MAKTQAGNTKVLAIGGGIIVVLLLLLVGSYSGSLKTMVAPTMGGSGSGSNTSMTPSAKCLASEELRESWKKTLDKYRAELDEVLAEWDSIENQIRDKVIEADKYRQGDPRRDSLYIQINELKEEARMLLTTIGSLTIQVRDANYMYKLPLCGADGLPPASSSSSLQNSSGLPLR